MTAPLLFTDKSGNPTIKALLNNKTEAYLLIDTASNSTSLTREMAQRLGLTPIPFVPEGKAAPDPSSRYEYVSLDSIRFDRFDYSGDCVVRDTDFGSIDRKPVGGFIGTNLLKDFAVLLDFEKNQMLLVPNGKLTDTQRNALGFSRATQVAGVLPGSDENLLVPVQIGTSAKPLRVNCLVSAASVRTFVSPTVKINAPILYERSIDSRSSSLFFTVRKTTSAQVGTAIIAPFTCGFAKLPLGSSVLGLEFLSQCRVLLDYPAGSVSIARLTDGSPFPTVASRKNAAQTLFGVDYEPNAAGEWRVMGIDLAGAFAISRVQVGDIVRAVNGVKTDGLSSDALVVAFNRSRTTKLLKLLLSHDGKPVEVVGDVTNVEDKK